MSRYRDLTAGDLELGELADLGELGRLRLPRALRRLKLKTVLPIAAGTALFFVPGVGPVLRAGAGAVLRGGARFARRPAVSLGRRVFGRRPRGLERMLAVERRRAARTIQEAAQRGVRRMMRDLLPGREVPESMPPPVPTPAPAPPPTAAPPPAMPGPAQAGGEGGGGVRERVAPEETDMTTAAPPTPTGAPWAIAVPLGILALVLFSARRRR